MKAAVLHALGETPRYETYPDPTPVADNDIVITMEAAAVKNLDKGRASGAHYAPHKNLPEVVGIDGIGRLADGTRVYASSSRGMIAEKAVINKNQYVVIPEGLDSITAAALPNAIMGSALALKYRANLQRNEVVLVNGATGVTGHAAVQIAKYYGAGKVIATGRNDNALQALKKLGADQVISLEQDDDYIRAQFKALNQESPIDIVIDYLWGHPVELLIDGLKGGGLNQVSHRTRIITVGSMAGENILLTSAALRSSGIEILGSGIGSLSPQAMQELYSKVLPDLFQQAAKGKLKLATITAELKDIETVWNATIPTGKRLVITM
ncbi:zinc-binding alcohol dehydrogenase family protein [Chitinophaga silvatica]|uniref:Zinc-binding alcohol dehydrogenase family protein n=1 Tax=Chitinophaga silvatica TaxID=2282649 RepID=A0A3E1Y6C5_9BACT|nr:zinc-binding dehydrogenase [Chitinophaga silvatica]RFS20496.1 zinc-binding alcohol dehydrogenase family protein [Chitinophaga silvatica]